MIKNEEMWKFRYMDNVRIVDKDGNVNVGSVIEILDEISIVDLMLI